MSVVDEVKARLDIVDVVSGYVALQKAGRNLKARCPFHTEKTPSFTVNPERQTWRCFGACATGGDAFSFIMRAEREDFGGALRLLAQKTGVTLRQGSEGGRDDALYRINQEAVRFYQEALASPEGRRAMDYLGDRGVDAETISKFVLGLSPRGGDRLRSHLTGLGFDADQAVEAGLLRKGDDGSVRDFFWGRLMFPIHDRNGRVVGFGARSLDGSDPKYLNTAATSIFNKRATLYGLHMSAAPIRERHTAVIVEGYMDAIAAHQFGYDNVIASMGTALTEQQANQIKSIATNVVLALDPDAAGQEATLRSLESSWRVLEPQRAGLARRSDRPLYRREPVNLKIAELPQGEDPDALIRKDAKKWEMIIGEAASLLEYLIPAIASRYDLKDAHGKAQAAEALGPLIASTGNAVEQDHYLNVLALALGVSREALEASIGKPRSDGQMRAGRQASTGPRRTASVSPLSDNRRDILEDYPLALLLDRPELREGAQSLVPEQLRKIENREVFTCWLGCSTINELWERLDENLHDHLRYLREIDLAHTDPQSARTALGQSLRRLEQRHLQELQESLLASEDASVPPARELEEAVVSVNARLKELYSERG
jgi:DNA primase